MHRISLALGLGGLLITCLAESLGGEQDQGDAPAASRRAPGSAIPSQKVRVPLCFNDAPAAARVSIVAGYDRPYGPSGTTIRRTKRDEPYFYADGAFDVELPPGRARMTVGGGIETIPQTVDLETGTAVELTVPMIRWIDMAARGWYSGDSHVHLHAGGPIEATVEDALLAARAEVLTM